MKKCPLLFILLALLIPLGTSAQSIHMNNSAIQGWATGIQNISYGSEVANDWKTPNKALGHAEGTSFDIVSLGRGGQITLTFAQGISNGNGNDFAIFENGMSDTFLELAWVEVSSDGTHFVRFRNKIQHQSPVGAFETIDPNSIVAGLASKYRQGYGTLFDLNHMQELYNYVSQGGGPPITPAHKTQLLNNFPYLNLNNIQYIRIIDIVGDGSARDSYGNIIYDPYPTTGSAGFDLDAVAVLHKGTVAPPPPPNTFANWSFDLGLSGTPSDDSDNDGRSDLEEYFLGSNPTNATEASSYRGIATLSNQFEITYHRDPNALGIIGIETILELAQTNWVATLPTTITSNITAEAIEVKNSLPLSGTQNFYRLTFEGADE